MKQLALVAVACAVLGLGAAAHAAFTVDYTLVGNAPIAGWTTVTVYVDNTGGAPVSFLQNATFTATGGTTATRFMNQNFSDNDDSSFTTAALDFWNGDPNRGFTNIVAPVAMRGTSAGNSGPAYPGGYDGPLPLPAASAAWDTHFLGDFNYYTGNTNYKDRWFPFGTITNTANTLSGNYLAFSGTTQGHPMALAQLVVHNDRLSTIEDDGLTQVRYSITFGDEGLGNLTILSGDIWVPEPAALSLAGFGALGLLARRRH